MFEKLNKIFREDQISFSKKDTAFFNYDASQYEGSAMCVIRPDSLEQIRDLINLSKRLKFTITPRGSGTSLTGSSTPTGSILLDMSSFNKVKTINIQDGWVEVEPYVTADQLNAILSPRGFFFPIILSSHNAASLGGMAATNASGSYSYRFGRMSDWVLGMEYVDGAGRVYYINENTNFPDLIGSEGCFGVITRLRLKITKKIEKLAMGYYRFTNLKKMLDKLSRLEKGEFGQRIVAEELISKSAHITNPAYELMIEYDVSDLIFEKETILKKSFFDFLKKTLKEKEFKETKENSKYPWSIYGEDIQNLKTRREILGSQIVTRKYTTMEDPKIPREGYYEFIKFCDDNNIPLFGHIGTGIFHPNFKQDDKEKIKAIFALIFKLSGKVSGEHGIGLEKKKYLSKDEKDAFSKLKFKYDPDYVLNPDKFVDKVTHFNTINN
jgi:FAD/FMN-containing dehydrogenase